MIDSLGRTTAILALLALLAPATKVEPVRERQWFLAALRIEDAHQVSRGGGVIVGVLDTGVDATHPDLAGRVLNGKDFIGPDRKGHQDLIGHGTKMAGLIVANGEGLGVAPEARVLPVRMMLQLAPTEDGNAAAAVDWAVENGAKVLCLAFVSPARSDLAAAINRAIEADVVVVAGAGNRPDSSTVEFPASQDGVLAVGGTDQNGKAAFVSVSGPEIQLSAPAVNIYSAINNDRYGSGTGTSDATAIVAGVAALVRSKYPDLSAREVIHRMTATATDKGPKGRDEEYGYGIVDPVAALTANVPPLADETTAPPSTPAEDDAPWLLPVLLGTGFVIVLLVVVIVVGRRRR